MKSHNHDHLLREIISGDEHDNLREQSLSVLLGSLRRRRRARAAIRLGLVLGCACLLTIPLLMRQALPPRRTASFALTAPPAPAQPEPVKIISDEELFALFPGRPAALIGPPGRQEFVFLDQPPTGVWH